MQALPHQYVVEASGPAEGDVTVRAAGVADLATAPPPEFGGPGGRWTPEALLVAAVADCFILSFRGVARASRIQWSTLECRVTGTLDRIERELRFVRFDIEAKLTIPRGGEPAKAEKAMHRAEHGCLITRSLRGECHLDARVDVIPVVY